MAFDLHTVSVPSAGTLAQPDRLIVLPLPQLSYVAGSGAGANVTFAVAGLTLPAKYSVLFGDLGQAGDAFVTNRTQAGFTVNIAPGAAGSTLAAGKIDLVIVA